MPRQKPYSTISDFILFIKMMSKGRLISGPYINEFELLFKKEFDFKHSLTVGSCRSAFALIVEALNVKSGDEIILPALNLSAFPKILKFMGIKPVFVDIDQSTFNIDINKVAVAITPKTKAIVAVHLYGNVCDMEEIINIGKKHNLFVIEDCANAFMTKFKENYVGTYGDVACFSHSHSKDLPTFGGGTIITNNTDLHKKMTALRNKTFTHPSLVKLLKVFLKNIILKVTTLKYVYLIFVYPMIWLGVRKKVDIIAHFIEDKDIMINKIDKVRFTNFQAAIGINKLNQNNINQKERVKFAQQLNKEISCINELSFPKCVEGGRNAYYNYTVLSSNRTLLVKRLINYGIDAKLIQNYNCNDHKIFDEYRNHCPVAQTVGDQLIALPLYSMMKESDVSFIAQVLKKIYNGRV